MKPVPIDTVRFGEFGYRSGEYYWLDSTLAKAAKEQKCRPFKLPLRHIDLTWERLSTPRAIDFAYHCKRAMATDLSIPIIMSPVGVVIDGYHRIVKALVIGQAWVWCQRLDELPECDQRPKETE